MLTHNQSREVINKLTWAMECLQKEFVVLIQQAFELF